MGDNDNSNSSASDSSINDLAIIGGGPTGLFAAFYAGLRQMSVTLIDSLDVLGGQLATLYPEKFIFDVAGFPRVLAKDLASSLVEQALQSHPTVALGQRVEKMDFDEDTRIFSLHTQTTVHRTRAILIAAGVGAFAAKTLPLPDAARFVGHGLHYFVKDPRAFAGQRVLIVGGGDSAVDWTNALAPLVRSVTLIHRRDQFRAHEESVTKMKSSGAEIKTFFELADLLGDDRVKQAVIYDNRIKDNPSASHQTIDVDAVLVNVGFNNSLGPIKDWGLTLEGGAVRVDGMMQTNRPGIFAAGDIAAFPGKIKLIATGFGEACIAVNFAKHFLDPKANIFPGHSSNLKK